MKRYGTILQQHLAKYAKNRLGVYEKGTYKGKAYGHILPPRLRFLNILESVRAEVQDYLSKNQQITLHKYFHHLNSSQAFAMNLFYPHFAAKGSTGRILSTALGVDAEVRDVQFEFVPVTEEKTNVDVAWRTPNGTSVFCEVKLSESGFGTAEHDLRHVTKLANTYLPKLRSCVSGEMLQENLFFKNYQLLRYVWLLACNPSHRFVVLMPKANEALGEQLQRVREKVAPDVRERMGHACVEDCLNMLRGNIALTPELRIHAANMQEKYVP